MFSTHRELPFGESFIEIGRVLQELVFAHAGGMSHQREIKRHTEIQTFDRLNRSEPEFH